MQSSSGKGDGARFRPQDMARMQPADEALSRLEPETHLHADWEAEVERMSDHDREVYERFMARDALQAFDAPQADEYDEDALVAAWQEQLGLAQSTHSAAALASQRNLLVPGQPPVYHFQEDNPYLSSEDPWEEALALYSAGKLVAARLAFEAVLQRNPNDSNCWRFLGTTFAENDDDKLALVPLMKALEADPTNLEALLELGVSFTNEVEEEQALTYLRSWLTHHPDYVQVAESMPAHGHASLHEEVVAMFEHALTLEPHDPDLHAVLGVLYNLSLDFDQAEAAFAKAVELDPANYSLWNKLGATQANGRDPNGSMRAVRSYRKALELKPNYVRSWVNMGISYANQGKPKVAAKYYLKAITLNPAADHVWHYLRFTFASMQRPDLVALAQVQDATVFQEEFGF